MATRGEQEEEEKLREFSASLSAVRGGAEVSADAAALLDVLQKRQENAELEAKIEEQKKYLESLKERIKEKQEEKRKQAKLHADLIMLHKEEDPKRVAERAEREKKEDLQKQEEERRLREEYGMLVEQKKELQRQIEKHAVYYEYMERVVKLTQFKDVQCLARHLECLLHFREQLLQKERETDQQVEEQRKALSTLQNQHHLVHLQKTSELSELQTKLTTSLAEVDTWEKKWNHIQETATKEKLQLGEVKMAVLNLYEMVGGNEDEEEPVDINDTEKQLEKVKVFFQDNREFLRQHQAAVQRQKGRKERKQGQKGQSGQLKPLTPIVKATPGH